MYTLGRRGMLGFAFASLAGGRALAQASDDTAFIRAFADALVAIINGPAPQAEKKAALGPVIDKYVDVTKIARFCLGRAWVTATQAQQARYITMFHQVLLNEISGHLGDYRGVSYSLTGTMPQGANTLVGTTINRPNVAPINVQWVVDRSTGTPLVIDVVAEGTSMRLTKRTDYASYLSQHGNDIAALLSALQSQLANPG